MTTLRWSDALSLDLPAMDKTHEEFVSLLGLVSAASGAALIHIWRDLIAHTQEHFEREDQWMQQTHFSSTQCHSLQHKVVLQVMREGLAAGEGGDLTVIRLMASELGQWFANHVQSMDAALALHLRKTGYDPVTGVLSMPKAWPVERALSGSKGIDGDAHQGTPRDIRAAQQEAEAVCLA